MAQSPKLQPPSLLSSTLQSISNYFKPHRAEALQRIRVNAFCFISIVVFSNLLPLPSLQSAIRSVTSSQREPDWVHRWFCNLEVTAATIFVFNILEGMYAVKYPRPHLPPYASPAKTKPIFKNDSTPKRPFKVLSPHTSPQPQKPFSPSRPSSFSGAIAAGSTYPTSPLSTPSRVLHYPDLSGLTNLQRSSTSTMAFQTPSPVMSAYRGKHIPGVGRALDASFLSQLESEESDADDESKD